MKKIIAYLDKGGIIDVTNMPIKYILTIADTFESIRYNETPEYEPSFEFKPNHRILENNR